MHLGKFDCISTVLSSTVRKACRDGVKCQQIKDLGISILPLLSCSRFPFNPTRKWGI